MRRREFLAGLAATGVATGAAAASGSLQAAAPPDNSLLMITTDEAARIHQSISKGQAISKGSGRIADRARQLRAMADKELTTGPWSVAGHRPPNSKLDPHDYYSEGPYFWPDPKNPKGPYIRKDGERNPKRFERNRSDLGAMSTAVLTLSLGAYFLDDQRYAERASKVLMLWFLDPRTRMNPNLEHGQAVLGVNDGRGTGLIDTVSLIHCAQGIRLLVKSGKLNPLIAAPLRQWFSQFLNWMTTSEKGKAEGKSGNNHATWWTAQVAAYATLTGNQAALNLAWERYRNYLVPEEIQPNGSCPREEARTKSLSYSAMNADGFATLCRIAQSSGVNLWSFKTPKGIGYEKVVRYLEPYVLHPQQWKGKQIEVFKPDSTIFLGLAGAGLHANDLVDAYKSLPRADSAWVAFVDMIVSA